MKPGVYDDAIVNPACHVDVVDPQSRQRNNDDLEMSNNPAYVETNFT